jgi:hypothetical protein
MCDSDVVVAASICLLSKLLYDIHSRIRVARLNPYHNFQVLIDLIYSIHFFIVSFKKEFFETKEVLGKHNFLNIEKRRNFLFSTEEDRPVWGGLPCSVVLLTIVCSRPILVYL